MGIVTQSDLMAAVDADVFEIECADGSDAPRLIRDLPWVHGVAQFGIGLTMTVGLPPCGPVGRRLTLPAPVRPARDQQRRTPAAP